MPSATRTTTTRRLASAVVAIALLASGTVLLGGAPAASAAPATAPGAGWRFAPATTHPTLARAGRMFDTMGSTPSGQVVMYGGQGIDGAVVYGDTWTDDGDGWVPRCGTTVAGADATCGPDSRIGQGMASTSAGVLLYGGITGGTIDHGGGSPTGDAWLWNGTEWSRLCDTGDCAPGMRFLHGMTGNGTTAILYGGFDFEAGGLASDTWLFDGTTWTQTCGDPLPIACGPGPIGATSITWDGSHYVMVGGVPDFQDGVKPLGGTWIFDGTRWVAACGTDDTPDCGFGPRALAALAGAPGPAAGSSAALMTGGGDLFTGDALQTMYRDAWAWNGSTWTEVDAPWSAPALVFDPIGNPPDDLPYVIGVMTSRPKTCDVELLTGSPSANGTVLNAGTWIGGVDGNGLGVPTGCAPPGPTQEQVVQWLKVVAFCRAVQFYRTIAFFEHMDRIITARRRAAAVIRTHRRAATTHRR